MSRGKLDFGATIKDVLWRAQDDGKCWLCSGQMQRKGSNHPHSCTLDHIWPRGRYGAIGDIGVTLLAHKDCNARRGSPAPTDAEIRTLVSVWRRVDRHWLRWNLHLAEADLRAMALRKARVELLKIFEAA